MGSGDVTALLRAWGEGDLDARDQLVPLVYGELHRRAATYLRLVNQRRARWQNRAQFLAVSAQIMRRILVDHARGGRMAKRPDRRLRVTLHEHLAEVPAPDAAVLDLDAALTQLATFDSRKSQVAELRFFGGLSLDETAHVLGLSVATVERDWQAARAWLYMALKGSSRRDAGPLPRDH